MCIYYLISFTKSIYFLLNFQIPFMFWITILPLNILYYPTNESILQFQLLFLGFFPAFWLGLWSCFGDFCSFNYFFSAFSGFLAGFRELFWGFLQFQLLFTGFSPAFWLSLGCFFSTSSVRSLNCFF